MKNDTVLFHLYLKDSGPIPKIIGKIEEVLGTKLAPFDGNNMPPEFSYFTIQLGLLILIEVLNPHDPENRKYEIFAEGLDEYHQEGSTSLDISHYLKRVFLTNGFQVIHPKD